MTTEQLVRDQLDRATREVVGGPDLEAVIRRGRRQRRRHHGLLGAAAVTVVGVAAAGAIAVTGDGDRSTVVVDHTQDVPVAAPPGPTDYVAGTGVDEALAAVVAEHLPALPAPDDVYPSDSHTAGPMPDTAWASAEDWQAAYTENGNGVLVMTALPAEGGVTCHARCQQVPGGTLFREAYSSVGDDGVTKWYFGTYFARTDGTSASAWEVVPAEGRQTAEQRRHVSDADLASLVQDPRLTFAALGAPTP